MINLWYVLAILTMVIGHIAKTKRWAQFIKVYEPMDESALLRTLSVSHSLNAILPFRIGDFFRVWRAAKYLKNGYTLSIATVVVDLYLDVVTAGLIFQGLALLGNERLVAVSRVYLVILAIVLVTTLVGIFLRKKLKKVIQFVASVFNEKIELRLLYISYAVIACFKDIVRKLHKKKFLLYTVEMWGMYLLSYELFSRALAKKGKHIYGISDIFAFIFSENCATVLVQQTADGTLADSAYFALDVTIYMLLPLVLVWAYSVLHKRLFGKQMGVSETGSGAKAILPHLSENDKLAFLEMYFADENIEKVDMFLNINRDISILSDLSAGSNATTIMGVKAENEFCYRKYAFAGEARKLKEQYEWLERHKAILPLAQIDNISEGNGYFAYDMKYRPDAVGYFNYIHSMPQEAAWKVLKNVITTLRENLYVSGRKEATPEEIREYIDEKVLKNIDIIQNGGRYIKGLLGYETIVINGVEYPNFGYYVERLRKSALEHVFVHDTITDIHGDLTIENIVCCKNAGEDDFYMIDPNTGNRLNTEFLDYAKLLQSLHGGYEFLMLVKDVSIEENKVRFTVAKSQNYTALFEKYDALLNELFTREMVKSIYYHEIVHWLRLMPYKIRKNERTAVIFFAGLIMVMDDVLRRFEE